MEDLRKAGDVSVTRYLPHGTVSVGAAFSTEHDYRSRALSLQATFDSDDKNTTWALGLGGSDDAIDPVNHIVRNEGRQTVSVLAGVTRIFTPVDIGQLTYTHSAGHGYYSDPYKLVDNRLRQRDQDTLLAQWNHRFVDADATSRLSYRYYRDSFGVSAHTLSGEWVQSLANGWTLTPNLRLYSQRAADFTSIRSTTAKPARPSRLVMYSAVRPSRRRTSACRHSAPSRPGSRWRSRLTATGASI
jgi:hypothetical protein